MKNRDLERFMAKVAYDASGCWLWTGSQTRGYGTFRVNPKTLYAHRLSYEHFVGPIHAGREIDHLCRVPLCVNPQHLEAVTRRENQHRGFSPPGRNARKTHCIHGHAFTPANTWLRRDLSGTVIARQCRTCKRERDRRRHDRAAL